MSETDVSGLYDVYEVFVQHTHLDHHQHVGSVLAPSPDVAIHLARENFLRRDRAVNLWVVRKDCVVRTKYEDTDFFASEFDRAYRRVDGYSENAGLWKMFKQRQLDFEDIVKED